MSLSVNSFWSVSFWTSSLIISSLIFIILNSYHCWKIILSENDFDLEFSWDFKLSSWSCLNEFIIIIFDDSVNILNRNSSSNLSVDLFVDVFNSVSDWVLTYYFLAVKNNILKRSFSSSVMNFSFFWSLHDIQHFLHWMWDVLSVEIFVLSAACLLIEFWCVKHMIFHEFFLKFLQIAICLL